jgi:hypothetical protein
MTSEKNDDSNSLHRLPGTDEQETGGLIIKKKTQATSADDQHVFKVPTIPSSFGRDKLAAEKRRTQSTTSSSKRSKPSSSSFDEIDEDFPKSDKNKSRHLREQRVETPSSTRSSHHDVYDKSRPAPKHMQRGLTYGKEGPKQRR